MPRTPVYIEVKNDSTGLPVVGATGTVKKRSDATNATLYVAETGGTTTANPMTTDSKGRMLAWADPDYYNILIAGTGVTSYTVPWDGIQVPLDSSITTVKLADGAITAPKVVLSVEQQLGLNDGVAQVGRGKSIIATPESRTNAAYGLLTTPDRVSNVVLPTDGLIIVLCHMTWQNTVASDGEAAIFLGSNQVVMTLSNANAGPGNSLATGPVNTGVNRPLVSTGGGLSCLGPSVASNYLGPATTGEIVGTHDATTNNYGGSGPCYIFAAAGTYDVSVQFKATTGTVTVKNRKLWVWTVGF